MLIEQDIAEVVVQQRVARHGVLPITTPAQVTLESIGLTVAVEAIYECVDNAADMRVFWAESNAKL